MDNNDKISADESVETLDSSTEDGNKTEVIEVNDQFSGQRLKTVTLKDGKPHGELIIYNEDGTVSHKLNFVDGVLSGPAEIFQGDQILMLTYFKNGQQDGETTMFMNQKKSSVMHYKGGKLNGPFLSYDDQEHLIREVNYVEGKMDGECLVYYPDGSIMERSTYKDDKLEGEVARFYQTGEVREISNYENGVPIGYIDTYDINGNLLERTEV